MHEPEPALDFDVDHYINWFIPRPRLHLLPKRISWFLGYRSKPTPSIGSVVVWFWSFIGAFGGILVIEAVFQSKGIKDLGAPTVIASLGAAAILEYNTIDSPLAQPRNAILGQLFASIIGVSITKLFLLNPNFEGLRWVAGALAVGLTSAFMGMTKTIHPPAGATALLAATTPETTELGWLLVPLIVLGSVLMVAVACVINNIQRQFPMYWWTPINLSQPNEDDIERQGEGDGKPIETLEGSSYKEVLKNRPPHILINDSHISIPDWLSLNAEEIALLEVLRSKLQGGLSGSSSRDTDETRVQDPEPD